MSPLKIVGLIIAILFFAGLLFPTIPYCGPGPLRIMAKNDVVQIVNALKNYHIEYGHFPGVTPDGFCETAEANAKLMQIILGLDKTENPRDIRFLEVPKTRRSIWKSRSRSGIDSANGAWIDPWGNFYRIRITADSTTTVQSPYSDEKPLPPDTHFIVWSVGKDGVQGSSVKSDDVTSWR